MCITLSIRRANLCELQFRSRASPISEDNRGNDSIVIRKSIFESREIPWGSRWTAAALSRRHEKRTLQYDPVFAASAETSNSRRAARRLRSEDELVLLIYLTKRFRFFVNTANIGGFWCTRGERGERKEADSYVVLLDVDIAQDVIHDAAS